MKGRLYWFALGDNLFLRVGIFIYLNYLFILLRVWLNCTILYVMIVWYLCSTIQNEFLKQKCKMVGIYRNSSVINFFFHLPPRVWSLFINKKWKCILCCYYLSLESFKKCIKSYKKKRKNKVKYKYIILLYLIGYFSYPFIGILAIQKHISGLLSSLSCTCTCEVLNFSP